MKVDIVVIVFFITDCPFGKYLCVSVLSVRRRNYRAYESKYDSLYRTCGSYDMLCSIFRKSFSFLDAIGFAFILSTVFIVAYISVEKIKKNPLISRYFCFYFTPFFFHGFI